MMAYPYRTILVVLPPQMEPNLFNFSLDFVGILETI